MYGYYSMGNDVSNEIYNTYAKSFNSILKNKSYTTPPSLVEYLYSVV